MNEERPRPEYGEYATPQDQARAMGQSYGGSGITDASNPAAGVEKPARKADRPERNRAQPAQADEQGERPLRTWDAVLTAVFLAIGVGAVLVSIPQFADLYDVLNTTYLQLDRGQYTSRDLAEGVGFWINAGQIAILVVTIALSVRALRAGRIAFYIPLLGGLATLILTVILLAVAMTGDPALMDSLPA